MTHCRQMLSINCSKNPNPKHKKIGASGTYFSVFIDVPKFKENIYHNGISICESLSTDNKVMFLSPNECPLIIIMKKFIYLLCYFLLVSHIKNSRLCDHANFVLTNSN